MFRLMSSGYGHHMGRSVYPAGYYRATHSRSIAQRNRHTGKPHEHKREIARRMRQQRAVS